MRDHVLVQAQNQLDGLAATMAQALSNDTMTASGHRPARRAVFDIDTAGLLNGNRINLTYTDTATNTQHNVSIVRVDDPSALPLDDGATADPNDEVFGVDFSGGLASVVTQLNAQFGGSAAVLQSVRHDAAGARRRRAPTARRRSRFRPRRRRRRSPAAAPRLPLFTDGVESVHRCDHYHRRAEHSALPAASPSIRRCSAIPPSSCSTARHGDRRPDPSEFHLQPADRHASSPFRPNTGLGNAASPFTGKVAGFLRQVLSMQGEAAANASSLSQGQDVVVNALQQRFNDAAGVNVDQEMANLITLQTAYGANARVMSAVTGHARHADEDVRMLWR